MLIDILFYPTDKVLGELQSFSVKDYEDDFHIVSQEEPADFS